MWVCRMTPSSHSISRCLPWLSTDSISPPGAGRDRRSAGAPRTGPSARRRGPPGSPRPPGGWCRPPALTAHGRSASPRQWRMPPVAASRGRIRQLFAHAADFKPHVQRVRGSGRYGSSPTWARARRIRRSWPPVIWLRTRRADRLGAAEPGEVEGLLRRLAVAVHRHDVGQAHGVVAGIVEPRAIGVGEVLDDGERRRVGGQPRQGQRAEVLLEVTHRARRAPARRTAPDR